LLIAKLETLFLLALLIVQEIRVLLRRLAGCFIELVKAAGINLDSARARAGTLVHDACANGFNQQRKSTGVTVRGPRHAGTLTQTFVRESCGPRKFCGLLLRTG
jgi:hypothetical protein